tara:strand:+ start:453 stop:611 length:159 start_codon:yes stop_codon:yes gene_type:complete
MEYKIIPYVPPPKYKKYIYGKSIINIKEKPKETEPKILNLIIEINNIYLIDK